MEWLGNNWIWIVFVLGMLGMHMFGHGGHGRGSGHGGHGGHGGPNKRDQDYKDDAPGSGEAHPEGAASKVADLNDPVPSATVGKRHKH